MDYGGKYLIIRKALHEAGFDDFYQAGSVSKFHKMNIVAESAVLGAKFWFCIDGGYMPDQYFIITRKNGTNVPDEYTRFKNQHEMADQIQAIGKMIAEANKKQYERFKLQWMIDHGYTLGDMIRELDKMRIESDPDMSLESIFSDWEFGYGFNSEIWPCFDEYMRCKRSGTNAEG